MDYAGRLSRLRSRLEENDLDALLITHRPNVRYLCGFTGSAAALIVTAEDRHCILFTDGRYRTQARQEINFDFGRIAIAGKSPLVAAADWLAARRRRSSLLVIGIEAESITAGVRDRLAFALKGKAR